jgi:hypothetical protein
MVQPAAVGPVRADAGTAGVSTRPAAPGAEDLAGTVWVPEAVLDAYGTGDAGEVAGVRGEALAEGCSPPARAKACCPPGLYAGNERRVALNVIGPDTALAASSGPTGSWSKGW